MLDGVGARCRYRHAEPVACPLEKPLFELQKLGRAEASEIVASLAVSSAAMDALDVLRLLSEDRNAWRRDERVCQLLDSRRSDG